MSSSDVVTISNSSFHTMQRRKQKSRSGLYKTIDRLRPAGISTRPGCSGSACRAVMQCEALISRAGVDLPLDRLQHFFQRCNLRSFGIETGVMLHRINNLRKIRLRIPELPQASPPPLTDFFAYRLCCHISSTSCEHLNQYFSIRVPTGFNKSNKLSNKKFTDRAYFRVFTSRLADDLNICLRAETNRRSEYH